MRQVGPSSWAREGTQTPCTGSAESRPLDLQGSPPFLWLECPPGLPCIFTQAGKFPLLNHAVPCVSCSQPPPFLRGSLCASLFFDFFAFVFRRLPKVPLVGNLRLLPSLLCCEATTVEPGSWFCVPGQTLPHSGLNYPK